VRRRQTRTRDGWDLEAGRISFGMFARLWEVVQGADRRHSIPRSTTALRSNRQLIVRATPISSRNSRATTCLQGSSLNSSRCQDRHLRLMPINSSTTCHSSDKVRISLALPGTTGIRHKLTRRLVRVISSSRRLLGRSLSNTVSLMRTQLENLEKTYRRRLRRCSVQGLETVDTQGHRM
jgi:hypothetical protein